MKSPAHFAAAFILFASAIVRAQAMGKATVDGPAEAPGKTESIAPISIAPTPATIAPKPSPTMTVTARQTVSDAVKSPAATAPSLTAATEPAILPKKVDEQVKATTVVAETKPAETPDKTPASKPAVAAKTPATENKVSIEDKPIRPAASTDAGSVAPKTTGGSSSFGGIAQVGTALAVVIGLIFIGKAMARKFVPGAKAGPAKGVIEILARHPLSKNQSIVLVRIGSQIVALNQGRDSSESVLVISDAGEVAKIIGQIEGKKPHSISAGFSKLLSNARMDLEETPDEPELHSTGDLDEQLEEMAAAKRQLMELRHHVRSVRDRLPRE